MIGLVLRVRFFYFFIFKIFNVVVVVVANFNEGKSVDNMILGTMSTI